MSEIEGASKTPTIAQIRSLKRKAESIHRKCETLASEVLAAYGTDGQTAGVHSPIVSDDSDSLLHMAEEMCESLANALAYRLSR